MLPQGAGKGTQSERLLKSKAGVSGIHGSQVGAELASAEWDIKTVVVGDLLRKEIRKGTALGERADQVMKAGCAPRRY